jgi:uncharacterized membrane protein YkoI
MNLTRQGWIAASLVVAALCPVGALAAQEQHEDEGNPAAAAKAALSAHVTLQRGLAASASQGRPISAKFEVDEGKPELSVYTMKGGKFYEVTVDPNSGRVVKTEAIGEGEDYTAAQSQSAAMAKAKKSLQAAVAQALRGNSGFRAVSVMPSLKDDRPVADVTLAKGEQTKTVSVPL